VTPTATGVPIVVPPNIIPLLASTALSAAASASKHGLGDSASSGGNHTPGTHHLLITPPMPSHSASPGTGGPSGSARAPSAAALCSVKRNLKKPFKAAQLIHALLQLSEEDATIMPQLTVAPSATATALSSRPSSAVLRANQHRSIDSPLLAAVVNSQQQQHSSPAGNAGQASPDSLPALTAIERDRAGAASVSPPTAGTATSASPPLPRAGATGSPESGSSAGGQHAAAGLHHPTPPRSSRSITGGAGAGPSARSSKLAPISQQYPLKILLAEDNLINQKMMVMLLRKLGYEIVVASNGREALAILEIEARKGRAHEISCILMDASMDVMDGMECTRVIRAQQLPHRVRPFIIAQTANVTEEYRRRCLDSGMDMFTSKPVDISELVRCLKIASRQHQEQQQANAQGISAQSLQTTTMSPEQQHAAPAPAAPAPNDAAAAPGPSKQ